MSVPSYYYGQSRLCGCWFPSTTVTARRKYLPQVELSAHTQILATTSRTTLTQTFVNNEAHSLDDVHYTFPLYDGVSVVGFKCTIGSKVIVGVVKERHQARAEYQEAVSRGETAGLLEQLPEASDVFTTSVGNIPAKEKFQVELVYLGELKHDAETDGSRFTIPTMIAPRYGSLSGDSATAMFHTKTDKGRIAICVDVTLPTGGIVQGIQSPSHPIAVTTGRTSSMPEDSFDSNHASATLTLGTTELEKDFVIVVLAKDTGIPRALLETHSTIPNQRALMATLVPKFNLPNISPEIVFVVDRSGSMEGKMELLITAMKVFLKSLPVGVKFNICSFGSSYSFLFKKSTTYDQSSLTDALNHLETFGANYGGTEMLQPVKATVENRFKDLPLEVMLLTDGEIWNQQDLFSFVKQTPNARFFTLGIGPSASSALVEGVARAGNGFAQFVGSHEKMDKRVVRMLKGALTPHVSDYTLEVKFVGESALSEDEDFEMVDRVTKPAEDAVMPDQQKPEAKKPISLFDLNAVEEPTNPPAGRYDNLPTISTPKIIQAPHKIPALFPFNRTTVYLILGPEAPRKTPESVVLRGTSAHGPLELEIPVQDIGMGQTIHQLAAKKAVLELEEGGGWIAEARSSNGQLLKTAHEGKWDLLLEREAVRLGVEYQVGGKWCSFVAVDSISRKEIGEPEPMPRVSSSSPNSQVGLFAANVSVPRMSFGSQNLQVRSFQSTPSIPPPPGALLSASYGASGAAASTFGGPPRGSLAAGAPSSTFGGPPKGGGIAKFCRRPGVPSEGARGGGLFGGALGSSRKRQSPKGIGMEFDFGGNRGKQDVPGDAGAHQEAVDISKLDNAGKMHQIIGLVEFDGSWLRSKNLLNLLGVTEQQFTGLKATTDKEEDTVRATVLAVAWLKVKASAEKDIWDMVADKATEWLATRLGGKENAEKAIEQAEGVF
ncbi:uncharacterized protein Z520_12252 [Fonsecaea multimorphosa CBS 102226]|uniref:VIT domain-containing protein n=1 Tax=Fonsecaea multimorphosa CBS 102226 TaxID=1442371 RepID=A0A0D2JFU3_9EURO|nr:uncharacterized protein Z520_12252 [Fonsecaea multimorphosa CBS 102226]KIX92037.1 hypothetical protein Z520_12252 [Fonsecaea multimorphosa CBS 102226]OAL17405.1 hypothetical protein AYO22_11685 [Fonsecaea multimorphosa]